MNPNFLFACCQPGAEATLKAELLQNHPDWRFAFSRGGMLTFKWAGAEPCAIDFQLKSNFARTYGWSLGPVAGDNDEERHAAIMEAVQGQAFNHLHVWHRQFRRIEHGLPKVISEQSVAFGEALRERMISADALSIADPGRLNWHARSGQRVLDVIELDTGQWWLGWHQVQVFGQRWAGGVPVIEEPSPMVSRAYLKMKEMLAWSELPILPNQSCVEIGSSPGGASQALLEAGLNVTGVDPAVMHEEIMKHKAFRHIRKRGTEVKRTEYSKFRWMTVDVSLIPNEMLKMVEEIIRHPSVHIHGMLLTVKLHTWEAAADIPTWINRVKALGYDYVRCRQLASNHQEVCIVAMRSRGMRRLRRLRREADA